MKQKILYLMAMLILAVSGWSQTMTTMGTDFWFTYLKSVGYVQLKVFVSAPRPCSVTLTNPATGWDTTAAVYQGVVTTIDMRRSQAYSNTLGIVQDKGIHLTSTDTVSVYIALTGESSFDETNVFPTVVLQDKYVIQNYPADNNGSEFVLLATEDSTWVDIYLSDAVSTGTTNYAVGDTMHIFLSSAGKTYLVRSMDEGDLSGTRVESRSCKRLAVFHGNECVYIPDYPNGSTCDHVIEQAIPTNCWGKEFAVISSGTAGLPDRVRITALEDGCVITRNGTVETTIDALETYEYPLYSYGGYNGADFVTTSSPASVNVYFSSTGNGQGDPSMVTVPPLDQAVKNITFNSSSTFYTNTHYVNVVVREQDLPYLYLDGNSLNNSFLIMRNNHSYQYRKLELMPGSHTLQMNGGAGFVAYAFGLGTHESYAYSIGSGMQDLTNRMVVGGHTVNPMSDLVFCKGDSIRMYVETPMQHTPACWFFGDNTTETGDTVSHVYNHTGEFVITAVVTLLEESCFPSRDTIRGTIRIVEPDTTVVESSTCDSFYVWGPDTCYESGTYIHHLSNRYGCDSLLILNLSMHQPSHDYTHLNVCDSITVDNHVYYTDDTVTTGIYQNRWGCDSIVSTFLQIHHSIQTVQELNIKEGDTLYWIDGLYYNEETDEPFVVLHGANGCDSIIHLHLHLIPGFQPPPVDSAVIWVPNIFTPEEGTNKEFVIKSNDITYMHVYIFTRGGAFVTDFDGLTECWDGRRNGELCRSEAYVYLIEYTTKGKPNYKQRMTGTVLLLR